MTRLQFLLPGARLWLVSAIAMLVAACGGASALDPNVDRTVAEAGAPDAPSNPAEVDTGHTDPWHCNGRISSTGSEGERCDAWWSCDEGSFGVTCTRITGTGRYSCQCDGGPSDTRMFETQSETCQAIDSVNFLNARCNLRLPLP